MHFLSPPQVRDTCFSQARAAPAEEAAGAAEPVDPVPVVSLDRIAAYGCIVCWEHLDVDSPAEIHHLRAGVGLAQRSKRAIGLCFRHHRTGGPGVAIHAGVKTWQAIYGTEEELWQKTMEVLG